jgi:hypothetical protein
MPLIFIQKCISDSRSAPPLVIRRHLAWGEGGYPSQVWYGIGGYRN